MKRRLLAKDDGVKFPCFETIILFLQIPFPDNQDYLFYPVTKTNLILYTHNIDYKTSRVLVKNTFNQPLHILCQQKLYHIIDICYNNCFLADANTAFYAAAFLLKAQLFFERQASIMPP